MECTERQLSTGLADRLGGDHADSLTFLNQTVVGQVTAVALGADTLLALAGENRTDLNRFNGRLVDAVGGYIVDLFAGSNDKFAGNRIDDIVN